ncbi:hypothetical protein BASA50_003979 [Batrachochytrium salamandrivorans]|uniref:Structural maintenance of chromosomes protein n=1 Tax=Batrachochytrium salamandrivorans TaxID=1357716 RepID=A0ABQ8FGW5_9FUNG|nr:hypothetical protein BASA60_009571 [Batrachochytrium salamandrivorans]KAH6598098.1 hypothetical protein BASA50_003979 [Batrachochytrium salamandrivorans]
MLSHAIPLSSASSDQPASSSPDTHAALGHSSLHQPTPTALVDEENTPRLVISKIVQNNFKSYAGKVEIGPFHKSFTSIVGPNGSGKSNVIDSLLFVFGFKAKKLRQERLSGLIHSSATHPNLTSCSVEVHFQEIIDLPGINDYHVVPGSQIVISRVVEKSQTEDKKAEKSTYYINGRTSTYTHATKLLKEKGVDLDHKRFLILQGEVESIALMKPKAINGGEEGLLEYLEDIIGTSHYEQAIADSSKALEECTQEREEKLQRLKIIQGEKAILEEKKQDALEYIQTENMITFYNNQLFQRDVFTSEDAITDLTQQLNTYKIEAEQEKEKFSTQTGEAERLESTFKEHHQNFKRLEEEVKSAKADLQKFDRAEIELKEKERHLNQKYKKTTKSLEQESFKKTESQIWVGNFQTDLGKAQGEVESLNSRLQVEEANLEEIRQGLQGKTDVFQQQIEEQQIQLSPWNEKINSVQSELDVSSLELAIVNEKLGEHARLLEAATLAVTTLSQTHTGKMEEINQTKCQISSGKTVLAKIDEKLNQAQKEQSNMKANFDSARQKCDDVRIALQAATSRSSVHASLMRESNSGNIVGICGRLGDLGTIDDKYDVAITTACSSLDAIVVETVETGQKCIEYLKSHNLGRAVFICLDKFAKSDMSLISTPENVPRLFDLVKPKEHRFASAFYEVLRDTVVAVDMAQANRIAFGKKRFHTVTLEGQLIHVSGAMTGGGSRPRRGGMSSKFALTDSKEVSPESLIEFESIRDAAENSLRENTLLIQKLEAQHREQQIHVQDLIVQLAKLEVDLSSIQSQRDDAILHLKSTENSQGCSTDDIQRASSLEGLVQQLQNKLAKYRQSSVIFEQKIASLQEEIMEVGGIRLRSQNAKVDSINDQIQTMSEKITKLQVEKGTREASLRKLVKAIAKYEAEILAMDSEMEKIKESLNVQTNAAQTVRHRVNEAQSHLESSTMELEEITLVRDEIISSLNSSRSNQVQLKTMITETAQKLISKQRSLAVAKEALTKLSLQLTGFEEDDVQNELPSYSKEDLASLDFEQASSEVSRLEANLKKLMPNLGVLNEYRIKMELYMTRASDLDCITAKRDTVKDTYDGLRKKRLNEFMAGFTAISQKLKEMYQMITMGGNAELELVDSLDPFSEGVIFSVMPPKKSWKNIANLSGGEKTLSSLALVFALHHFKPTPLYVMDEIDAALDFRNVSIVANYIKQRTKNAQFVIISLRNNMFELADRLVGVYKTSDASKSVTIDPKRIAMEPTTK